MSTLDDIIALLPLAKAEHDGMIVQLAEAQAEVVRLRGLINPVPVLTPFRPAQCSPEIDAVIRAKAKLYNLPRWWLYAIIQRESSFNPKSYNPNGGYGLTQLTGKYYVGMPYPMDLATPDDSDTGWRQDMGFPEYGQWLFMAKVSRLTDPMDPAQNLDRFCTVFAVQAFAMFKARDRFDDAEVLRKLAWSWNHGIALPPSHIRYSKDMKDPSYLELYDTIVDVFRPRCEAEEGGPWDGKPVLP